MRLAAHQPQYLPWLGFFDKMDRVDRFVLLDVCSTRKMSAEPQSHPHTGRGNGSRAGAPSIPDDDPRRHHRREQSVAAQAREALRIHHARSPFRDAVLPALEALLEEPSRVFRRSTCVDPPPGRILGVRTRSPSPRRYRAFPRAPTSASLRCAVTSGRPTISRAAAGRVHGPRPLRARLRPRDVPVVPAPVYSQAYPVRAEPFGGGPAPQLRSGRHRADPTGSRGAA